MCLFCSLRWVYGFFIIGFCIYLCLVRFRGINVVRVGVVNGWWFSIFCVVDCLETGVDDVLFLIWL